MKNLAVSCLLFLLMISVSCGEISRRQQFFKLVSEDPSAAGKYLADKDPEIRRYALYLRIKADPAGAIEDIRRALKDPDEQVRLTAVTVLPELLKKEAALVRPLLMQVARSDSSQRVRQIAVKSTWPFHREIKLLRNDPSWDYEVKTLSSIPLPRDQWRFVTDPLQDGHLKGFFKPGYDISGWKNIRIGTWEQQGYADYDGVAWYQIKFKMPLKPEKCNAVEVVFGGVDEAAWVWLNGVYLGAHDIGPEGWKEPFAVDCRKEIRWGAENTLTVRVFDAAFAGGIYKPVRIDILQ